MYKTEKVDDNDLVYQVLPNKTEKQALYINKRTQKFYRTFIFKGIHENICNWFFKRCIYDTSHNYGDYDIHVWDEFLLHCFNQQVPPAFLSTSKQ